MNKPTDDIVAEIHAALYEIEEAAADLVGKVESLAAEEDAAHLHELVRRLAKTADDGRLGALSILVRAGWAAVDCLERHPALVHAPTHWHLNAAADLRKAIGLVEEDPGRVTAALRHALANSGIPRAQVVDDGAGFVCDVQGD
ncbi:hypothetical protein [Zavarzinia compransoris]|uniref:Uncharacterized protein n=1 Tax=Zavarzinia compransoris TaxID=1264899 RepID=A0A317E909_9PROT|nr:hypothetical protein [Zavarzinia compransoris]PWR23389.1 hypothetical protein DKG75_02125 [Zavarzinia compransoris]TDP46037.1 hypothetical protein DES42_104118 [Zavarzinia compransoris]